MLLDSNEPSLGFGFPWWEGTVTVLDSIEPIVGTIMVSGSNELKLGSLYLSQYGNRFPSMTS